MKKLIFLALMAFALVGFVSAGAAHPPGVFTLEAALSVYSVDGPAVTTDTVLATVAPALAAPSSFQAALAVVVNDNLTIRPHNGFLFADNKLDESCTGYTSADFYLRC